MALVLTGLASLYWAGTGTEKAGAPRPAAVAGLTAEQKALEEARCRREIQCWGEKHIIAASVYCQSDVERLARFKFEWTDRWYEKKFSHFKWANRDEGSMVFFGDKIMFQNGFGAFQAYTYSCTFNPSSNRVIQVDAAPGRNLQ